MDQLITNNKGFRSALIRGLRERGYSGGKIAEFFVMNFGEVVSKEMIYREIEKMRRGKELVGDRSQISYAKQILREYDSRLAKRVDEALEKAEEMSLEVDNKLISRIGSMGDSTLARVSRDLFERKRVLQNKPTTISGKERLSDTEIYERINKLRAEGRVINVPGGEGVVDGVDKETGGGTDKVLETASRAIEGDGGRESDKGGTGGKSVGEV